MWKTIDPKGFPIKDLRAIKGFPGILNGVTKLRYYKGTIYLTHLLPLILTRYIPCSMYVHLKSRSAECWYGQFHLHRPLKFPFRYFTVKLISLRPFPSPPATVFWHYQRTKLWLIQWLIWLHSPPSLLIHLKSKINFHPSPHLIETMTAFFSTRKERHCSRLLRSLSLIPFSNPKRPFNCHMWQLIALHHVNWYRRIKSQREQVLSCR